MTREKTAREKRQKMTRSCTKETVSPVSKKQERSPSEQSLWNKDSLQTFCSQPIRINLMFELAQCSSFEQQPFKEMSVSCFEATILYSIYASV